jgi:site-specific DNA-cytosine methylase
MLVGAPTLCADVHQLEPADLRRFFGPRAPDLIMMSPPCKGFSALLPAKRASEPHYQRLNALMERALFLIVSAWDTPSPLVFVENVPRIQSRGRETLRRCVAIGESHGYAIAQGTHDCGELGGLAQHRRRWFMLWRHRAQLGQVVYEPAKLRVRACGEVLGPMPMPGDVAAGGPMHAVPGLSWKNWVRLALIPAGGDWRDLPGVLADGEQRREHFRRAPVTPWEQPAETVTGPGGSQAANVADPRIVGALGLRDSPTRHRNKYTVSGWDASAPTVIGASRPGSGAPSVADPRWGAGRLGVTAWTDPTGTVAGDPRPHWQHKAGVTPWSEPAPTVTGRAKIHAGAFQVADPRVQQWLSRDEVRDWLAFGTEMRAGLYGVLSWQEAADTITGSLSIDTGRAAVADPRIDPDKPPPFTPVIIAADGTCHRPLTTLELAALQSLPTVINGKPLVLAGRSHTRWREAIGNLVPPAAARAVAEQLARALLVSKLGAFALDCNPIWVSPRAAVA